MLIKIFKILQTLCAVYGWEVVNNHVLVAGVWIILSHKLVCQQRGLTWDTLVTPILLFSFISWHWSLKKAFLSLLAILWNSAFRCLYLSFFPLFFASLLFITICKASPDSRFAFLHFFSVGMVLIPVSCTMSRTSFHSIWSRGISQDTDGAQL